MEVNSEAEEYDCIVVGSGPGGLSAAICLARAGQKVLVLEQHYVPGGWCHSFMLKGQRFCPGIHYIGALDKGQSTAKLYEGLGIANDLTFFRLNKKGYEHCFIDNKKVDMPASAQHLFESLALRFPAEKKSIKKYLNLVQKVNAEIELMSKLKGIKDYILLPFKLPRLLMCLPFSLKRVINWYIKDLLLQDVLNIQCGDHGLAPKKVSFIYHCGLMSHYVDGGFYPLGGGGGIVKAMTNALKKHGGEIKVKHMVKRILLEGEKVKRAVGVELENGLQIRAKYVISNADPEKTFRGIIGEQYLSQKLISKLNRVKYSVSSLILFLTVDVDVRKFGIDSGNIWLTQKMDLDKQSEEMLNMDVSSDNEFPGLFISCTTLKDPVSYNGRYHNFEVVTFVDNTLFADFIGNSDYQSEKYTQFKQKLCEKFLKSIEKIMPGIRGHIVQMELGTPKTNSFYINSTNGNVYGTEKNLKQVVGSLAFHQKTEIENLYLCGASTLSHGAAGAGLSGVKTAAVILKCKPDDLLKEDLGQDIKIYDADDSSTWPQWVHNKMEDKRKRFKEIVSFPFV